VNAEPLEIFKWIGLVIAAGFIGYFGRYFAMLIIDRMQKKKDQTPPTPEPPRETPPNPEVQLEETRLKLEKKKAKAEAKRLKKAGKK
jgi:hypothetical protein